MKILHLIDSGGLYGAEVMLLNLVDEQRKMGLEPVIASIGSFSPSEKPLETEALLRGLHIEKFRMCPGPNLPGAYRVLRFAWNEKVDVLHSHGYKANILFGLIPRRVRKLPMVTTIHGWTWTGEVNRMALYEWFDSFSLNFIDRIVLVNRAMKEHPRLQGRSRLAVEVVENGIPMKDEFIDAAQLDGKIVDFCRGGFTVGAIGRLSREKGFNLLLEAVANLVHGGRDLRLVIMGEGDLRIDLQNQVRELGLEARVLMPGYVESARDYLPFFKMFVISSLTEGLPIVLLEAMLAGVPIVSTSVGGVPEVLQQGKAGILVPVISAAALADGIVSMILNADAAMDMIATGRELVMNRYAAQSMAVKYNSVYETLRQEA